MLNHHPLRHHFESISQTPTGARVARTVFRGEYPDDGFADQVKTPITKASGGQEVHA